MLYLFVLVCVTYAMMMTTTNAFSPNMMIMQKQRYENPYTTNFAKSKEEDLELTRQVIRDYMKDQSSDDSAVATATTTSTTETAAEPSKDE